MIVVPIVKKRIEHHLGIVLHKMKIWLVVNHSLVSRIIEEENEEWKNARWLYFRRDFENRRKIQQRKTIFEMRKKATLLLRVRSWIVKICRTHT